MARVAHGRRVLVEGGLQRVCCGDWRGKEPRAPDSPPFAESPALERARPLSTCPSIREETSQKAPAHPRSLGVLPATRSAQLLHWPRRAPFSGARVPAPWESLTGRKGTQMHWDLPATLSSLTHESCGSVAVVALTDEPVPGAPIKSAMVIQTSLCIPSLPQRGF